MPRTDEAEAFFHAVYSAIQEIPYGKVTSYGHIAKLVGTREYLFQVFNNPFTPSTTFQELLAGRERWSFVELMHE